MSEDDNRNVILRWFDGVNNGDIQRLAKLAYELFTLDFILHDPRMTDFEPGPVA